MFRLHIYIIVIYTVIRVHDYKSVISVLEGRGFYYQRKLLCYFSILTSCSNVRKLYVFSQNKIIPKSVQVSIRF